jgi:uncharacterized protein (TIGR02246 family)
MNIRGVFKPSRVTAIVLLLAAGAVLAPMARRAKAAAPGDQSLAARVQRLEDIEQIRTLLLDYGRALDARDFATYSHLFAKDGEWVGGFGSTKGPAAIQAFMEKNIPATPGQKPGATYHLLTNFVIDPHGDTATAWSRWAFIVTGADNKPSIMYGGHYDDTLVRENAHWRFKRRVAFNDIPYSDPTASK